MKKLMLEIAGIIFISGLMGLAYNETVKEPVPMPYHEKKAEKPKDAAEQSKFDEALSGKNTKKSLNIDEALKNTISYEQLKQKLNDPNLYLIDARSPHVYKEGHIGNAVNIYPYLENQDELMQLLLAVPDNKVIVIYCDGGDCDLSHDIARKLIEEFTKQNVFLYQGGWEDWSSKTGAAK